MAGEDDLRRLAWHDITCADGEMCDVRDLHSWSTPIVTSGVLDQYHDRLQGLRQLNFMASGVPLIRPA